LLQRLKMALRRFNLLWRIAQELFAYFLAEQKVGCLPANAGIILVFIKAPVLPILKIKVLAGTNRPKSYAQVSLYKHKNLVDSKKMYL